MAGVRRNPEADIQRAVVARLRSVMPGAIVHHSANEIRAGGAAAARRQAIQTGMGVYAGFADLLIIAQGRVMFLEVKSATGRLSQPQRAFRDAVQAQGFAWALVRSQEDAVAAVRKAGFTVRERAHTTITVEALT